MFLFSIGCLLLLRFDVFVCRAVVLYASLSWLWPWFVHGRLQCQIRCVYSRFRTGLVIRGRHVAVPYLGLPLLVNLFCYLGAHYGFSHRREGVGYALRVSPVVTRLTVYRRPQVYGING